MTLNQALTLIRHPSEIGPRRSLFLACGFQPLHLATFLKAEFAARFPGEVVEIQTGHYGDLEGTLAAAARSGSEAAVVVEWSDLDPRLGLRSSGGWGRSVEQDILATCRRRLERILAGISELAAKMPVAVAGPSLQIPLFGHTPGGHLGAAEAELQIHAARFQADVALLDNTAVVHPARLARLSPEGARLDANMELATGFPYSLGHASALASQLIKLLHPTPPMKGLITDLDETLWSGIVGEVGISKVRWHLADRAQIHGLYQQQLRQLSEIGVLLGIVSKNEPKVVEEALRWPDLYVSKDLFYPVCAGWQPKSQAVGEILAAWNVGPESVVFIDDSSMEIDEVRTAFPSMTCLQFPARKPGKALELFEQLRDLFGKPAVQREDQLRQASIRTNAKFQRSLDSGGDWIGSLGGKLVFDWRKDPGNKRLLELINKTNQFNLNGVRLTEGEWRQHLVAEDSVVASVTYEDKFGPLGVIGVVAGKQDGERLALSVWVLSCRAFSRKIEHHTLDFLFRHTGAQTISLAFQPTDRNQPLQAFFQETGIKREISGEMAIHRNDFHPTTSDLPHLVLADGLTQQFETV